MRPLALVMMIALLFLTVGSADASLLSDWFGIELAVDETGTFNHDWTPTTATADYFIDDNWSAHFGRPAHGGEQFDIEAMYFDNDATNAYIAVVTSFNVPGGVSFLGEDIVAGDLALDLGLGMYEMGIDIDGGTGTVAATSVDDWYQGNDVYIAEYGLTNFSGGMTLGTASVDYFTYDLVERGYGTYVFEITVDRSLLTGAPIFDNSIGMEWTIGCRNDVIHLDGDFDDEPVVPEPSTILLLGTGLLGMAGVVRRRRK
jgi:hypothetical protein